MDGPAAGVEDGHEQIGQVVDLDHAKGQADHKDPQRVDEQNRDREECAAGEGFPNGRDVVQAAKCVEHDGDAAEQIQDAPGVEARG